MRCDLHVHTRHSGMCNIPLLRRVCRESYNDPRAVYETLQRRGMNLVTVTDHDSIDAAEELRRYPDFFLSEEVTWQMPSGTTIHAGVYGITERQHLEIHCRREDVPALAAYLGEQRIFFSINHAFSSLTGRRDDLDFVLFEELFPALESRNGQLPAANNEAAARLVRQWRKAGIGGSDAHTLSSLGFTYTEVPAARDAAGFLDALRAGHAFAAGASGNYGKLTRAIAGIGSAFVKEQPWAILLAPLLLAIPAITLGNYLREMLFLHQASAIFSGSQLQMRFSK